MPESAIQLVCFDLGGVLVRVAGGWREACRHAGVTELSELPPEAVQRSMHDAGKRYERGELETDAFIEHLCGCLPYDAAQMRAIIDAWLVDLYPGVGDLFDRLEACSVPTACLSNTNAAHWECMAGPGRFSVLDRLGHRFASHLIGVAKPDERIYAHVDRHLGLEPGSVIFFDDLPENCEGARRRGWQAQRIDPTGDPVGQVLGHLADHRVLRVR